MLERKKLINWSIPAAVGAAALAVAALWYTAQPGDGPAHAPRFDAVGVAGATEQVAAPVTDPDLLLPDLQALPPEELYVAVERDAGTREIRFSTTVANLGEGPLEMGGTYDPATGRTRATQRIESIAFDGLVERYVGDFVYHPSHSHWHFESFTEFELWTYEPDGELDDLVASSDKMTFCVMDTDRVDSALRGAAAEAAFGGCGTGVQGLSVGWGDTYSAGLPGQQLDISDVPDGRYAIRSTADPEDRLQETDETNNAAVVYVQLTGDRITRLPDG